MVDELAQGYAIISLQPDLSFTVVINRASSASAWNFRMLRLSPTTLLR
ncbi:MAG: hypothetical protein H0X25_22720 [Acidobacteriales bacterium]|nr:hypothetical protein [Terriglobales bacterium]